MTRCLIVTDAQNDFVEGGSLPVAGGDEVCRTIAHCVNYVQLYGLYDYYIATKDFHLPGDSNGGHITDNPDYVSTWPSHCIQGTEGAGFHPAIAAVSDLFNAVFYKGEGRPDYSGFQAKRHTYADYDEYLGDWLADRGVTHIDVVGLATDHCVKATAIDGILRGLHVRIPVQLTAAVGGPEARDEVIRSINKMQGLDRRIN